MPLKTTLAFESAYARLNQAQKIAVDSIEGPVLVVAGPGTGKTQVLAARIAHILLKTDINPYNILALTFTDSAAKNMRERVVQMIGQAGYYVQITTFHSFCAGIIKSHPEFFPIDRDSQPLTDIERFSVMEQIISDLDLDVLKPLNRPYFYIKDILRAVSDLKREGVSVEQFEKIISQDFGTFPDNLKKSERSKLEKQALKNQELLLVYQEYEERLRKSLRYDFDDMISLVVTAFKTSEELLQLYQEQLQYILVDEYQDTNSAQNKVVLLLGSFWGVHANIFVVGDPHQSIYRFQGASVENVYGFLDQFPNALVVTLKEGYRCPQPTYDAAHRLIEHNTLTTKDGSKPRELLVKSLSQRLHSNKDGVELPEVFTCPSQLLELVQVAEDITKLLQSGVAAEEIAVLYRTNAEASEVQQILERWDIPYEIDGGSDALKNEVVGEMLQLFRVVDALRTGEDGHLLFEVLCYPWMGLDSTGVFKIARAAGAAGVSIYSVVQNGYKKYLTIDSISPLSEEQFAPFSEVIANIQHWAVSDATTTLPEWYEKVINESGLLAWVNNQTNRLELLLAINAVFAEVTKLAKGNRNIKLSQFLAAIDTMQAHAIAIQPEDLNASKGAVQLATVHKAKGREWEYVFLIHCIDGRWGNKRKVELIPLPPSLLQYTDITKKERNEDERRLFYVAMTRAKKQAIFSYPETVVSENRSQDVVGSMFLVEIADYLKKRDGSSLSFLNNEEQYLSKLITAPAQSRYSQVSEKKFFEQLVQDFTLSASSLNDYLHDQEHFVTHRLLKIPQAKTATLAYGTAMHAAMERIFSAYKDTNTWLPLESVLEAYERALERELLVESELKRRLEKGKQHLTGYYAFIQQSTPDPIFIERLIGRGMSQAVLDDIPLMGRIDRIDWQDRQAKHARVVDYKTGKVQSVNEIEGKTVSAGLSLREQSLPEAIRGPYKRQLLFYKLLTDLDSSFTPVVTHGTFEFLEPTKSSNKYVARDFTLHQSEVNLLKDLILEVMSEIRSLQFLE